MFQDLFRFPFYCIFAKANKANLFSTFNHLNTMPQIEYYKLEQRDMLEPGKTRSVYRLKQKHRVDAKQFIKEVAHRHGFKESTITGVLIDVADELAELLGSGYSVELPNIGVFSIGVRMKADSEEAEGDAQQAEDRTRNARSLELHHINYRKNSEFFNDVVAHFNSLDIQRIHGKEGVHIKKSQYPQVKNRMIVAREFLRDNPFMTVSDYARITGLSYTTAQRELKASWENPAYGIKATGHGTHRVYVLR